MASKKAPKKEKSRIVIIKLHDPDYADTGDMDMENSNIAVFVETTKTEEEIDAVFDETIARYENNDDYDEDDQIEYGEIVDVVAEKIGKKVELEMYERNF